MNITHEIYGDLPPLTLSTDDLKKLLISLFRANSGTFYFTSFINYVSSHLISRGQGFKAAPNTKYSGGLGQGDQARIREIIWDMIIDRHLTIGGNGHDDWPNFSVTERGKLYFAQNE